jgi:nucleotide-binding universal stress UspA family protein
VYYRLLAIIYQEVEPLSGSDSSLGEREGIGLPDSIVVGASGSECSRFAIAGAASLAKATGQAVVVVFVRNLKWAGTILLAMADVGLILDGWEYEAAIVEAQSIAILDPAGLPWRYEICSGDPAKELIRMGERCGASTIVVGGRRSYGLVGGLVRGAVSNRLVNDWPLSVLVVDPPDPQWIVTEKANRSQLLGFAGTRSGSAPQKHWVRWRSRLSRLT